MRGIDPTLVTILRHGQVNGRPFVYRGALNDPMTEQGAARVWEIAERLAAPAFDRLASSPLVRCLDFAEAYARESDLPLDVLDSMREMHFGAWEGLTPVEAARLDPTHHELFRGTAGKVGAPEGESVTDLRKRVRQGWQDWLAGANGGHRLLVTHAGVMRALLMELIGLDPAHAYRIALPEAAHFQVSVLPGEAPVLLNLNPCAG
jgi:broad specificity phosphatase PhoE